MNRNEELEALVAHLEELTEAVEEDHTPEFLAHLQHESPEVRAVAVRGLWDSDPTEVLEPLWRLADQDPDTDVRATALSVLGRYIYEGLLVGDEPYGEDVIDPNQVAQVRSYLEGILYDEKQPELLRRRALEALSFDPGPEETALIEKWQKASSPELRMTALFAMGRSGLEGWEKQILHALEDKDHGVRREAIRAVGEAGLDSGIKRLSRFVEGDDRELALEAIAALGEVGGEEAVELLESLAESEDEEIAEVAQIALERAEEFDFGDLEDLDDDGDGEEEADEDDR